jgi:glycosyltransferase involved in cell wall biosynthesis
MIEKPSAFNPSWDNIRVSLFVPTLDGGGAELIAIRLAQGLLEQGFRVDLVLAKAEGEYLSRVPKQVRVIDLKSRSPVILFKTIALHHYLRQEQPDVLISILDIVSAATWAQRFAKAKTRVIMTAHTHLSQQFQDKPELIGGKVRSLFIRWFYPQADAIVAVSQGVAKDLAQIAKLPFETVRVIYNPVVTPEVLELSQAPIDHPWFAPGEPPVILGVGRLVRQKDFATLVRAFALVRQQCPARLMILGNVDKREPNIKPQLEALIQELQLGEDVLLPGFVSNPYAYMAKAAVFALSSLYEGFGNVVVEALAAGTPVVATDCESGPAEILEYGKYGRLVPVGDYHSLAKSLLDTLHEPVNTELLQQRAKVFSIENVIGQYVDVVKEVTASKPNPISIYS